MIVIHEFHVLNCGLERMSMSCSLFFFSTTKILFILCALEKWLLHFMVISTVFFEIVSKPFSFHSSAAFHSDWVFHTKPPSL